METLQREEGEYYHKHNGWPNGCASWRVEGATVRPVIVLRIIFNTRIILNFKSQALPLFFWLELRPVEVGPPPLHVRGWIPARIRLGTWIHNAKTNRRVPAKRCHKKANHPAWLWRIEFALFPASELAPVIPIEDVYINGILREHCPQVQNVQGKKR